LAGYGESPIAQYEAFVVEYCAKVRKAIGQLRADLPIDDPEISVTLLIDIPPEAQAEWDKAWAQFKRIFN
jgi:hypothetical protein